MKKKSKLLKVVSIIMIFGGALNLIFGIIIVVIGGIAETLKTDKTWISVCVSLFIILLGSLNLCAGIIGVKVADEKGNLVLCKRISIVIMVVATLFSIITIMEGVGTDAISQNLVGAILSLLIPSLYYIGADKINK